MIQHLRNVSPGIKSPVTDYWDEVHEETLKYRDDNVSMIITPILVTGSQQSVRERNKLWIIHDAASCTRIQRDGPNEDVLNIV